jgi:xanthine dehydrogenase YagS FAD-binding subunit
MLSIVLPESLAAASKVAAERPSFELKAGGTDIVDRVRHRAAAPAGVIQLRRLAGLDAVAVEDGVARVGALVTLADVAQHPTLRERAPLLVDCAEATATPQIRAQATVGGALCQRPRCPYFRDELFVCAKVGGDKCLARHGDHHDHAIFDNGSCMAPHPSTLGAALLAHDATALVRTADGQVTPWSMEKVFAFDLDNATVENGLPTGALIEAVTLPLTTAQTRHRYLRASSRHLADWASAEVAVFIKLAGAQIAEARVVLGGVARTPRRAKAAEQALKGARVTPRVLKKAAAAATEGATPLADNRWKVELVEKLTLTALEEALS